MNIDFAAIADAVAPMAVDVTHRAPRVLPERVVIELPNGSFLTLSEHIPDLVHGPSCSAALGWCESDPSGTARMGIVPARTPEGIAHWVASYMQSPDRIADEYRALLHALRDNGLAARVRGLNENGIPCHIAVTLLDGTEISIGAPDDLPPLLAQVERWGWVHTAGLDDHPISAGFLDRFDAPAAGSLDLAEVIAMYATEHLISSSMTPRQRAARRILCTGLPFRMLWRI